MNWTIARLLGSSQEAKFKLAIFFYCIVFTYYWVTVKIGIKFIPRLFRLYLERV
jgi:hypothetical protein